MLKLKSGYILLNPEKVERALNGVYSSDKDNPRKGGIGKGAILENDVWMRNGVELTDEEVDVLEKDILAEYDKNAGAILRGNDKVRTGSFYDFAGRKARAVPKIEFEYKIGNKTVIVPDGKELPGEIKAQKILKETLEKEAEEVEAKPKKKIKRTN